MQHWAIDFVVAAVVLVGFFVVPWSKTYDAPYQCYRPYQLPPACELLPGAWPEDYGCINY